MDCGGGGGHSSFDGGCPSSGASFGGSGIGGSGFGGMNTSQNTHFTSTTHSSFGAHPTSTTTRGTGTTVSGSSVHSTTNYCVLVFLAFFFIVWFGVAGFIAYMAATNFSPFLAFPPICIALLGFFGFMCIMCQNFKRQRGLRGVVNDNQLTTTQPQVHFPPQPRDSPYPGYPSSYPASQQPQWTSTYTTNYGQQQYEMSGQQEPRTSAPLAGEPEEDNPPSYNDLVGGTTPV